jgi:MoxR-like ATPase
LEDVPGVAKTMLARAFAKSIGCTFKRLQCTPDLLPTDVTGVSVFNPKTTEFEFRPGPLFAQIVLADEINRATPRTQSALLEAMAERRVSVDGQTYTLKPPFLVIATQNPVDQEGTYPLSEAQTDRFMLKDIVQYPTAEQEVEVMYRMDAGLYDKSHRSRPVVGLDDVRRLQGVVRHVHMDRALMQYAGELVGVTRTPGQFLPRQLARLIEYGASPRATIAFCKAARALALLSGRAHVIPEDIAKLAHRVLRHRLILGFEAASSDITPEVIIDAVLQAVRVP